MILLNSTVSIIWQEHYAQWQDYFWQWRPIERQLIEHLERSTINEISLINICPRLRSRCHLLRNFLEEEEEEEEKKNPFIYALVLLGNRGLLRCFSLIIETLWDVSKSFNSILHAYFFYDVADVTCPPRGII